MSLIEPINEPLDLYRSRYKEEHARNVSEYFEELVEISGVNEEENSKTVKEIRKIEKILISLLKKKNNQTGLKKLLIVLTVLFLIVGIICLYNYINIADVYYLLVGIGGLLFGIAGILFIRLQLNVLINKTKLKIKSSQEKSDALFKLARQQMEPLNSLFDWTMTGELVRKTIPLINLDPYFDYKRLFDLQTRYGLDDKFNKNRSVLFVQSGDIKKNPFVVSDILETNLGTKTYSGSITISWVETETVNGKRTSVSRSQTLTASIRKPCPYYKTNSFVLYGNDAAPDLSFSRRPSQFSGLSEKKLARELRRETKKLEKLEKKAVLKNKSFTALTNSEFDILFNALDRDNEVQFRLLFTPLAQRELLKLIKDQVVGYGDNFTFIKSKKLNYLYPSHLKGIDLSANPAIYISYDLVKSRTSFNNYNNTFFKGFYFAIAPLLAIPLYQQKSSEAIYEDVFGSNLSSWEHEAIAYYLGEDKFRHPSASTRNILKTKVSKSGKGYDQLEVTASGYKTIKRVDYISKLGRDGFYHQIPVPWVEYIPVENSTNLVVKIVENLPRKKYFADLFKNQGFKNFMDKMEIKESNCKYRKSILAFISNQEMNQEMNESFDDILEKYKVEK